jgi:hypothetical protein
MGEYYKESGIDTSGPLKNTYSTSMDASNQGKYESKILPSLLMVELFKLVEVIRLTLSWDEQFTAGGLYGFKNASHCTGQFER